MRISRFGTCGFFAGLAAATFCAAVMFRAEPYVFGFLLFGAGILAALALFFGKYHVLSEAGIVHKLLGIPFRKTPWSEVKDIMCLPHQAERGKGKVLMVTTQKGRVYRPEERGSNAGYIRQKGFEKDWLFGRNLFMLDCSGKDIDQVIAFVESCYGAIDYHYFRAERGR